jgi:hypothetical protein
LWNWRLVGEKGRKRKGEEAKVKQTEALGGHCLRPRVFT